MLPSASRQDAMHGVFAASATPLLPDLSCDVQELAAHYHRLIGKGCRGVIFFGTTGEGPSFSLEEKKNVLRDVIPLGIEPQRCIVGVICSALTEAVDLIRWSLQHRYLAVMVVPPFYFKHVGDSGVISFYRELIKRVDHSELRLLLYHIPQFSGVPITLKCIQTLRAEFPDTVIGLKESEGNLSLTLDILKLYPGFKVFVGNELQISEAVQAGAAGAIVGLANIFPELIVSLYEQGLDSSKPTRQHEIQAILNALKEHPIFPAIKYLIEKEQGPRWQTMRPPLIPLEKDRRQALDQALSASNNYK